MPISKLCPIKRSVLERVSVFLSLFWPRGILDHRVFLAGLDASVFDEEKKREGRLLAVGFTLLTVIETMLQQFS